MGYTRVGLVVGLVVTGFVAACTPPPPPSAATIDLEDRLLTESDVGGEFVQEIRGEAGLSGGMICPESDFEFEDVGVVRVSFSFPSGDIVLVEVLRSTEPGELDALFAGMTSAYEKCFDQVWTDYGDTQTVEPMTAPQVGDDRIAVHAVVGDPPFDGPHNDDRSIYVRSGATFMEISVSELHDTGDAKPAIDDDEFFRIVAAAMGKLTN